MLFKKEILAGIASGEVKIAFRKWRKPTVKTNGTLLTPVGQLYIERVDEIGLEDILAHDLVNTGYSDHQGLMTELEKQKDGKYYRINFHLAGEDPRIALRDKLDITQDELRRMAEKFQRLDRSSEHGPWVFPVLRYIHDYPGRRAGDLAQLFGADKGWLKQNIRKLKQMGLTISLEVGYQLSERGAFVFRQMKDGKLQSK